jgi:hypothetical protein
MPTQTPVEYRTVLVPRYRTANPTRARVNQPGRVIVGILLFFAVSGIAGLIVSRVFG